MMMMMMMMVMVMMRVGESVKKSTCWFMEDR